MADRGALQSLQNAHGVGTMDFQSVGSGPREELEIHRTRDAPALPFVEVVRFSSDVSGAAQAARYFTEVLLCETGRLAPFRYKVG